MVYKYLDSGPIWEPLKGLNTFGPSFGSSSEAYFCVLSSGPEPKKKRRLQ
jgi:hypothetical protein